MKTQVSFWQQFLSRQTEEERGELAEVLGKVIALVIFLLIFLVFR